MRKKSFNVPAYIDKLPKLLRYLEFKEVSWSLIVRTYSYK